MQYLSHYLTEAFPARFGTTAGKRLIKKQKIKKCILGYQIEMRKSLILFSFTRIVPCISFSFTIVIVLLDCNLSFNCSV